MGTEKVYVISVCDQSGFYIPVVSGESEEAAEKLFEKFRKRETDNPYWNLALTMSAWTEYHRN